MKTPFTMSMLQFLFFVFFYLKLSSFAAASDSFLECLSRCKIPKDQLANIFYTQHSINYTSVLQDYIRNSLFNSSSTHKPAIILTPFQESQVAEIVTCARKAELQLKIRSGGHDAEGLSYTNSKAPFAILDMFNLKSIDIDCDDETAWVQAGATLGELYYNIWQKSKVHAFPAGVGPTIGVGGHFSGGGYGNMMRNYGLSADNVIDAKIVDANGRILDRKSMGEDLFWAIRGGGGASFGVVLSYRINLVPVPPLVTVFRVPKTLEENATDLVYRWQLVADKLDKELFIRVFLQPKPGENNVTTVRANFIALFLGDAKTLVSLVSSKFPELGLKIEDCKEMSWIKSTMYWSEFPDDAPEEALLSRKTASPRAFKMKSDYVKTPISRDDLTGIFKQMKDSGNVWMMFNPYGGRMSEIPGSEIAFPHRAGNIYKIQYLFFWSSKGPDGDKSILDDMRNFYDYMTPFVSKNPRQAFLNYRDLDIGSLQGNGWDAYEEAKVYGVKYFQGNFDRLVRVKTKVDPTNFFRNEQSIPPLISYFFS